MTVRTLVLTGFGINCDYETEWAFRGAGSDAQRVHLNDLIGRPALLDGFHILAIPGGFSFGDDIASGKILANRLRYKFGEPLLKFIADGKLAIGICNGFQVAVKMGLLPLFNGALTQEVTLTNNDSGRFENRWVNLRTDPGTRCVWLKGITQITLPVRHGEGKFIPREEAVLEKLRAQGQVALRYCRSDGSPVGEVFPANPNGSVDDIAGICDPTGRIFGLMPHPEAHVVRTQHPRWFREALRPEGDGLQIFRNAVEYVNWRLS
ncbi:MAG: phosphoribosylformylglycinamidine synthase subunit PurQ [Candidatus Hydrogenedentes bacterium]|nr:phosphoribosylformylglycinamidine synthase subunit PurQ [Candidatus Hydrogenedentota bacterium]